MDVVGLAAHHAIDGDGLVGSVRDVAQHRGVELAPLATILDGYGDIGQQRWAAWRRKQQVEDRVPEAFADVVAAFIAFADPAISANALGRRWNRFLVPGADLAANGLLDSMLDVESKMRLDLILVVVGFVVAPRERSPHPPIHVSQATTSRSPSSRSEPTRS